MRNIFIETRAAPALASFTIDAKALETAATFLAKRVIDPRNSLPILSTIHVAADPAGTVTLSATDLDNFATVTMAADVETPGAMCIDGETLASSIAKARKGGAAFVTLQERDEGGALVKAGRASFTLKTQPVADFPIMAGPTDGEALSRFTVPAPRFLQDLAALAPCQSTEETRKYLNGIALQARDLGGRDRLAMVATDGHNMAIASRPLPAGAEALADSILPRRAVAILGHAGKLAGECEAMAIECGDKARFTLGNVSILAKLYDGTYPDWARAFDASLAPTDGEPVMFPELLPGAPLQSMDKLAKAAKARIDWQPARQGFLGTVPGDDGLLFGCLAMAGGACQQKGYHYGWTGEGQAREYLLTLAEGRGLTLPAEFEARAAAVTEAFGDDADCWKEGYRARPWGVVRLDAPKLVTRGNRVLGLTMGGRVDMREWTERETDWEALVERETWHPAETVPLEGSYSIVMPADGPGQLASTSAITGPDGVEYPVADNGDKIHLSKEQVRALIDESCFETMEITLPNGKAAYILRWLWDQGDSRFLTVRQDGRTFAGGVYVTRAEIEAGPVQEAPQAEPAEICPQEPQESESEPCPVSECGEAVKALSGPEIGSEEIAHEAPVMQPEPCAIDPVAELAARVAALEALIVAPLPAETPEAQGAIPAEAARPKRTAAHERAIRRAWAERQERRQAERLVAHVKARRDEAVRKAAKYRIKAAQQSERAAWACAAMDKAEQRRWDQWDKRRKNAALARQRGRDMAAMAKALHSAQAEIARLTDELEASRRSPIYIHASDGAEHIYVDQIGRAAYHARNAMERAEGLEARQREASATIERQQAAIERLGDELVKENLRAIRAETALAAVKAKANGWPPAVQSVKVNIAA